MHERLDKELVQSFDIYNTLLGHQRLQPLKNQGETFNKIRLP